MVIKINSEQQVYPDNSAGMMKEDLVTSKIKEKRKKFPRKMSANIYRQVH